METKIFFVSVVLSGLCLATTPLTPADFADCIGPNTGSWDSECILASGSDIYVNGTSQSYFSVQRSNITVKSEWPYRILRRASGYTGNLMQFDGSPSWVYVRDLIFDGGGGSNEPVSEMATYNCSYCFVIHVTFQNSPGYSLNVGPFPYYNPSNPFAILDSTFTNSAYGGVYVSQGSTCSNASGWYPQRCLFMYYNSFYDIGANAIAFSLRNAHVSENVFSGNHRTCPYNAPGGQVDLDMDSDSVLFDHNLVAYGPSCSNGWWADGVELHGTNLTLNHNLIQYNAGRGIYLEAAQTVSISGGAPSVYPIRYNNQRTYGSSCGGFPGISIHTSGAQGRATQDISIYNVQSVGGHTYGVSVNSCDVGQYVGPPVSGLNIVNSCFAGNLNSGNVAGVQDQGNCTGGSCIASGASIGNNQSSGCGGF